jgi:hypothetical protein
MCACVCVCERERERKREREEREREERDDDDVDVCLTASALPHVSVRLFFSPAFHRRAGRRQTKYFVIVADADATKYPT